MNIDYKLILDLIKIGIFTIFVGTITEYILRKNNFKNNFLTRLKNNNFKFFIILFLFGSLIELFFRYIGFQAYCEKKCINDICTYECKIKVNLS
jgi:hypothetical protein